MATAVLQCSFQRAQYIFQQNLRLNDGALCGLHAGEEDNSLQVEAWKLYLKEADAPLRGPQVTSLTWGLWAIHPGEGQLSW